MNTATLVKDGDKWKAMFKGVCLTSSRDKQAVIERIRRGLIQKAVNACVTDISIACQPKVTPPPQNPLQDLLDAQKKQIAQLKSQVDYDKNVKDALKRDIDHLRRQLSVSKPTSSGLLDQDLLKRIIMLCHPDKHGSSQLATTVTQTLLKMRK